jgi:hypothetical protein
MWLVTGIHAGSHVGPNTCGSLSAQTCQDAANTGTAIGAGLVIALWVAVDIIVGITYAVVHLTRKR